MSKVVVHAEILGGILSRGVTLGLVYICNILLSTHFRSTVHFVFSSSSEILKSTNLPPPFKKHKYGKLMVLFSSYHWPAYLYIDFCCMSLSNDS